MSELNQKEVNEQMYLFAKQWIDNMTFEESKKVPVMAIAYCLARLSKQDELLKEQEAVVRCKDCKYWYFADNRIPSEQENVCGRNGIVVTPDWYCADGERKQ